MCGLHIEKEPDGLGATTIIAVHGFGSNGDYTWNPLSDDRWGYTEWFNLQEQTVALYSYPLVNETTTVLTREGLKCEAVRLLEAIMTLEEARRSRLLFMGHDIGGTLIKEAFVQAAFGDAHFRDIYWSTSDLLFIGCPHSFGSSSSLESSVARLLKASQLPESQFVSANIASLICQVNQDFTETGVQLFAFVYNVSSNNENHEDRVFEPSETEMKFNSAIEWTQEHDSLSHFDMARRLSMEGRKTLKRRDFDANKPQPSRKLILLSSPRQSPQEESMWISDDAIDMEKLIQSPKFQDWNSSYGPSFLAIQNAPEAASTISSLERTCISAENPGKRFVQYFQFKEHDCRYASVQSMLFTFLAEIYCKNKETLDICWGIRQPDLKYNLMSMNSKFSVMKYIMSTPKCPEVIWILVNFNRSLPGAKWLLDTFSRLGAGIEMGFKVLFVNSTDIPVPSGYFQTLECPTSTSNGQSFSTEDACNEQANVLLDPTILELIVRNPRLHRLQPKMVILLRKTRLDLELHQMLVDWLSFSDPNVVMSNLDQDDLKDIPLQSQIFRYVLKSKSPILQPEQTLKLLQLVTLALRPLTIHELLSLDMCSVAINDCISSLLPGILMTRGNEARLSHRHLRDFILFSAQSETGLDLGENQEKAHGQIADLCLNYILSSGGRLFLERYSVKQLEEQAGPESRLGFIHYAVNYWPLHAKKANEGFVIHSVALQSFLEDNLLLMQWARAHSLFSKPLICLDLKDTGPLSIFAQYGLEGILKAAMVNHTNAPWYSRDCSSAVVAAAACGQINIVRLLLQSITHEQEVVKSALLAAFSMESEEMFELLLVRLHEIAPDLNEVSGWFREADRYGLMQCLDVAWKILNSEVKHECTLMRAVGIGGDSEMIKYILKQGDQQPDPNICLDWFSYFSKHNNMDASVILLKESLHKPYCDEKSDPGRATSELSMEVQQKQMASIQDVLKDAIKCGQHRLLSSLVAVMKKHSVRPHPVEDLFHTAIEHGKTACLQCLFDHYGQEVDIPDIRISILRQGTGAMLQMMFSINDQLDDHTFPSVIQAIRKGEKYELRMLEVLLKAGQKKNSPELYTNLVTDLLAHAVDTNDLHLAKTVIRAGADLEKKTLEGSSRTPLYHAAYKGYAEITAALIEAKADPHTKHGDDGWEAVHAAYDNASILRILLKDNANVDAMTYSGSTVLMLAVKWAYEDSVEEILKHRPDLNCTDKSDSLLSLCVQKGRNKIAFMLLDAGMNPCHEYVISINKWQLHICVKQNNVELLRRLLLYNFPLEEKDANGSTPLNCLAEETEVEILRLLLNRGASVNADDNWRVTPLTAAAILNNVQIAEFLLSRDARADIRNYQGYTPLHFACKNSSLEMVKILIDRNTSRDEAQDTTLFQTVCLGQGSREQKSAILAYLKKENKVDPRETSQRWGNNLSAACLTMDIKTIGDLIDCSVPVNESDSVGRRPIHFALHQSLELVEYLLDQGADLWKKDMLDRNPLHFAVISGRLSLVKYILEKNPTLVNEPDCDGWTPIFWALRLYPGWVTESSERRGIIKYLKAHGAEILIQAQGVDRRWTPYELSLYYSLDESIVKLLQPKRKHLKGHTDRPFWEDTLNTPLDAFKKGRGQVDGEGYCSICLVAPVGVKYECTECWDFVLCFKCYRSLNVIHPGHDFNKYNEDPEDEPSWSDHDSGSYSMEYSSGSESGKDSRYLEADGSEDE